MSKERLVRLTVRVPESVSNSIRKLAKEKKWSLNTFLQEALLQAILND